MNRSFKGVWIPKEIWCNKELNITERCFLTEIDSLDNDEGCFASNNYFADFFGLSKSRCSEIINKLEEKGLIKITYEYKENSKAVEKRIIKVVGFSSRCIRDSEQDGIRDSEEGVFEKPKDNNIDNINNKNNNIAKDKKLIYMDLTFIEDYIDTVKITQDQYDKLVKDYGVNIVNNTIRNLDSYIVNKKPKYKDHNRVLRTWLSKNNNQNGKEHEKRKDIPSLNAEQKPKRKYGF